MARRLALMLVVALLLPAGAMAAKPRANLVDIEDEVMCVTCRIPLDIADSKQADDERDLIRGLIAKGETKAQIKRALVGQYGDQVLALPAKSGFGLTAYLVPVGLGVLLLLALMLLLPRWRRRPPTGIGGPDGGGELSDEDASRLDADLARYSG
jgi:cytochrome c-type biogenesis protein CcmH/NrfF